MRRFDAAPRRATPKGPESFIFCTAARQESRLPKYDSFPRAWRTTACNFRCYVPLREIRLRDVDGIGDFFGVPGASFGGGPAGGPLASGPVPGEAEDGGVQAGQRGAGAVPAVPAGCLGGDVGPDEAEDRGERDEAGIES